MRRVRDGLLSILLLGLTLLTVDATGAGSAGPHGNGSEQLLLVQGDSVTADFRDQPLIKIALELQAKTGVKIHLNGPDVESLLITASFERISIDMALKSILVGTNYALVARPHKQGSVFEAFVPSTIEAHAGATDELSNQDGGAWHSDGAASREQMGRADPVPPVNPASDESAESNVEADSTERLSSVADHEADRLAQVLAAIQSEDEEIRATSERVVINELLDVAPSDVIATVARNSSAPDNRLMALEVLVARGGDSNETQMALGAARLDSDPNVRRRAAELLDELSAIDPGHALEQSQKYTD